ncbi:MAG TPA: fluoride efflux transporter CrcB [Acidimicrobiales bacterium]|jgi:CrcB protein|nr:fluoride efflux transporter CrcB [Acidimicrobiales bacterium]
MTDGSNIPIDPDATPSDRVRADVLAVIALGGMLGASARYGIARWLTTRPDGFPWATFWTNVSGSLVLGFSLVVILERLRRSRLARPFLATGVIGAFTTMSTYAVETALLVKDGHVLTGVVYALGSLVAGTVGAYGGMRIAGLVLSRLAEAG